jgi:hypothetical protein
MKKLILLASAAFLTIGVFAQDQAKKRRKMS